MLFGSILAFKAHIGKVALIDISAQFACLCFSLFVYSIGLVAFTSIPTVRATWPYCYNIWRSNIYDPPETYFCITTQNAVTCGLITWSVLSILLHRFNTDCHAGAPPLILNRITTMIVALLNLVQFRKDRGVGAIRLGDDTQLPSDNSM